MVFSSVDFLFLFLPAFLLVQFFLPWRNATFVLFSLAFYFVGEGWFTAIIVLSALANYVFGRLVERGADQHTPASRVWLGIGIAFNLALLFFYKYVGFFATGVFQAPKGTWITSVHLPLGISFFTFHAISYLVDIHRRDARAERSLVNLSLYMLMFPQLIAGPILRFHTVANQLKRRIVSARHIYYGGLLFCAGMAQKVLLADTLAGIADPLFARWQTLSPGTAWLAASAYTFQIFFDFSGYSNMAIGLGLITGFYFPKNFDYPYVSRSITEFWRRWHMSLSRWFRDYLYIPLGGNRFGEARTYRNLLIVFLLCGLWHGAAWTFVLWGVYHGTLLVIERLGGARVLEALPRFLQHAYAMLAVVIGWVLFRSDSLAEATGILSKMLLLRGPVDVPLSAAITGQEKLTLLAAVVFSVPWVPRLLRRVIAMPLPKPWPRELPARSYALGAVAGVAVLTVAAMKVLIGSYSPFIYFRF